MGLSADDIVNYALKQAVRGYSVPQVDELLDQVADTVERLGSELDDVRHRLRQSEDRLAAASETESTLKRTLVTAQRAAEQSLDEAREQAAELVEEARREAATLLEQARLDAEEVRVEALKAARAEEAEIRRRRQALEGHIEALRIFEREYRSRLREQLEEQLRILDDVQHRPGTDVPSLADETDDAPPIDRSHLGGATVPDEPQLRVRVREDEPDAEAARASDDDRTGGDVEVGSRAPDAAAGDDDVCSERWRSVP
jgi:cell division initiation protein